MASPIKQHPSFIFFPSIVSEHFRGCIHLTDNKLLKPIKCKKKSCVKGAMCHFLMKLLFFLGEETAMTEVGGGGAELKVTPHLKCLSLLL